jgi:uncharacterized protein (TIGR02300 family)
MSPARKRTTKGATKTKKKATRKAPVKKAPKAGAKKKATPAPAKTAAARKTTPKAAKKTSKREAKKTAAQPSTPATSPKPPKPSEAKAPKRPAASATRKAKPKRRQPRKRIAQPLESAEKKPGLGAKWACFSCGAKFYDLNRPDPICPKCQTDQREQPAKTPAVASRPPRKRPAAAPITRLLDEEERSEARFDEDSDAESAAELDIGKFGEGDQLLDDAEFTEESDD